MSDYGQQFAETRANAPLAADRVPAAVSYGKELMHKPTAKTIEAERYGDIREQARMFARFIAERCPESRELALALTSLQQTVMWANAAIAIHETGET